MLEILRPSFSIIKNAKSFPELIVFIRHNGQLDFFLLYRAAELSQLLD